MTLTLEDYSASLRHSVDTIGPTLQWDEDWQPVVHLIASDGAIHIIAIDPQVMNDAIAKAALFADILPTIFHKHNTRMASLVTVGWMSSNPRTERLGKFVRPSDDPMRREVVIVHTFTAFAERTDFGFIDRRPGHSPRISQWQCDCSGLSGLIGSLQHALAKSRTASPTV